MLITWTTQIEVTKEQRKLLQGQEETKKIAFVLSEFVVRVFEMQCEMIEVEMMGPGMVIDAICKLTFKRNNTSELIILKHLLI